MPAKIHLSTKGNNPSRNKTEHIKKSTISLTQPIYLLLKEIKFVLKERLDKKVFKLLFRKSQQQKIEDVYSILNTE